MGNTIDRCKDRFARFQSALKRLSEAILQYEDVTDETDIIKSMMRDSIIKRFEFTFELAWKVMKDYAEYNGYNDILPPVFFFAVIQIARPAV